MNDQRRPDQPPGYGGGYEGGPGPGWYGAPPGCGWAGYGFQPGMGPWGPPADMMGGHGPMGPQAGPGYGYGYGYGPMGPPPGYGPMGGPGFEQAGAPGAGRGPSMDELMEEMSNGGGLAGLGKLLDLEDTEFWKGALVGAAAVLLLTNESVQQSLLKSGIMARDAVEKGLGSLRGNDQSERAETPEENKAERPAKPKSPAASSKSARKDSKDTS